MTRYKYINGERLAFTTDEETARDAEEKAWSDGASNRRMANLRNKRNSLLAETDWMANSDVTMSDAWKKYRQDLRDITTQTPSDDELSNITFPTKPS
tara:strand:- start:95 stop:385 length:291 start_codon:yes stop_codon:yes gene_type:complete